MLIQFDLIFANAASNLIYSANLRFYSVPVILICLFYFMDFLFWKIKNGRSSCAEKVQMKIILNKYFFIYLAALCEHLTTPTGTKAYGSSWLILSGRKAFLMSGY